MINVTFSFTNVMQKLPIYAYCTNNNVLILQVNGLKFVAKCDIIYRIYEYLRLLTAAVKQALILI